MVRLQKSFANSNADSAFEDHMRMSLKCESFVDLNDVISW